MKNILFITTYTGIGGGETLNLSLMEAMDRSKFALHLLTPTTGKFPQAAEKLGVKTHFLKFRGTSTIFIPAIWAKFPVVPRLHQVLRDNKIDAVISDYHALPFIIAACQPLNIPVLWNVMGWWFPIYPWQRHFFQYEVDRIIAITSSVKEKFLKTPPRIPPDCIDVYVPGINTDYFQPGAVSGSRIREQLGISPRTPLVAMAARFQVNKGHEYFLEAAGHILEMVPDAHFAVAGDNTSNFKVRKDQIYKERILETARSDTKLRERVTYLGFVPDVREVIAASDVMVCSSLFESLLMVALESMAMERPIVSTLVGGPSETIVDGETGYLTPARDSKALADRVITLLQSPELRLQMGKKGREHVLKSFTASGYAETIERLLDEMIYTRRLTR